MGGDGEGGESGEADKGARGEGGELAVGDGQVGEVGQAAKVIGAEVGLEIEGRGAGQMQPKEKKTIIVHSVVWKKWIVKGKLYRVRTCWKLMG